MGSKVADKKRKSRESDSESDDELGNGLFDGVLSQSEDEEDYIPSDDDGDEDDDDESGSEDSDASEDEEEDDLQSDEIPSDDDGENEMDKLAKQQSELEITEPGVDPKPKHKKEEEEGERNYRIEKDAYGGVRYVYEYVVHLRRVPQPDADTSTAKLTPCTIRTTRMQRNRSTR